MGKKNNNNNKKQRKWAFFQIKSKWPTQVNACHWSRSSNPLKTILSRSSMDCSPFTDLEVAHHYLKSLSLSSLPSRVSGSESETGKRHRVLRESRTGTGTKNPSACTIVCCVGSAKPGAREKFTSSSEKYCHQGQEARKMRERQGKNGGLKEEIVRTNLAKQKTHKCQVVGFLIQPNLFF